VSDSVDLGIQQVLVTGATLLAVACALFLVVRWLRHLFPDMAIGVPIAVALALRIGAAAAIGLIGIGELRGGDEVKFVAHAEIVSNASLVSGTWADLATRNLHEFVIALQLHVLDSPDVALRIAHIGIAVVGIALLVGAAYELAGPRAATVSAWLLALEPTSVFYSGILHKEANLFLAVGLVALGGTKLWRDGTRGWVAAIAIGCLIAVATRYYVGVLLFVAATLICVHSWIRRSRPGEHRLRAIASTALLLLAVGLPAGWMLTTPGNLDKLARLQQSSATTPANLPLEPVDFSSREGVARGLPRRVRDVLVRPYPWQLGSTKQRIGLFGTVVVLGALLWLAAELIRARGRIMDRAGPLVYIGLLLLVAYSLSAANAGTAFRHRTQLVSLALCLIVVLLEQRTREREAVTARRPLGAPVLGGAGGGRVGLTPSDRGGVP
jgi:hypothetical protein